jgi:hypothetical protein
MENILKIIFFLAISIFLSSCDDSTTEATLTNYNIIGNIKDSNGNLLDDVNVYFVYHLNDIAVEEVSKINNVDTLYQNYPNPFSDSTTIRFETYRNIHYEIKFIDYNSLYSSILLQGSNEPGVVDTLLSGFADYPNGIYKLSIRYLVNLTTRFGAEITVFINRTQLDQLTHSKPNIIAGNGQFDVNLPEMPLHRIINCTGETDPTDVVPKQLSNSITFVLIKDGYKPLQVDYSIDRYNQNEFTFVMEKK